VIEWNPVIRERPYCAYLHFNDAGDIIVHNREMCCAVPAADETFIQYNHQWFRLFPLDVDLRAT